MIWWVLGAVYLLGIIPAAAVFLRTGLGGMVDHSDDAVLAGFMWPLVCFVTVPAFWSFIAITWAVEKLAKVGR